MLTRLNLTTEPCPSPPADWPCGSVQSLAKEPQRPPFQLAQSAKPCARLHPPLARIEGELAASSLSRSLILASFPESSHPLSARPVYRGYHRTRRDRRKF